MAVAAPSTRRDGIAAWRWRYPGSPLCPSNDPITAASLGYPQTGPVDGYAFDVYGWVVSKAPVTEVEFVHERSVVACCELKVSRPDVAEVYGCSARVGFWKATGTVGLATAFTIGVSPFPNQRANAGS
jgi:hypothetical protein